MQADNVWPNTTEPAEGDSATNQSLPIPPYPHSSTGYDITIPHVVEPGVSNSTTSANAARELNQCPHCHIVPNGRLEYAVPITRWPSLVSIHMLTKLTWCPQQAPQDA